MRMSARCKTHAVASAPVAAPVARVLRGGIASECHIGVESCHSMAQGLPVFIGGGPDRPGASPRRRTPGPVLRWSALRQGLAAVALAAGAAVAAARPCPGPTLVFEPLGDGLWRIPAEAGEADARNRGRVSNLLLARAGEGREASLWALGSGPSPAFGRALACQARRRLGLPIRQAISPWTRPEAVLGVAGLDAEAAAAGRPPVVHAAHQDVAVAMAGGYADDIEDIVDIHYATLERAAAHAGR